MNVLVFSDQKSAQAQQAAVDVALGYPKPGTNIGQGVHAPAWQSVTTTWSDPIQQSDLSWAYPVDATVEAMLSPAELADVALVAQPVTRGAATPGAAAVDSPQPK